jgi:acetolactate synthase-1/2/3 large subunit
VFTGGVFEEPVVRRADLIIAFGLDPVGLIPRPWPYAAPVLNPARRASTEAALRASAGGGAGDAENQKHEADGADGESPAPTRAADRGQCALAPRRLPGVSPDPAFMPIF